DSRRSLGHTSRRPRVPVLNAAANSRPTTWERNTMSAHPNFQILPGQDELSQMQRDLRFYPSPVTHPQTLSPDQVAGYNRDGYVAPVTIFSNEEADEIRAYFDALLARVLAEGGDSYSISTAHLKYGRVYDLLT